MGMRIEITRIINSLVNPHIIHLNQRIVSITIGLKTKWGWGASTSHSSVCLLHSSQRPRAAPSKDATPKQQTTGKFHQWHTIVQRIKKQKQSRSNHVNPHCGHCRPWTVATFYCQVPTHGHKIFYNQTWADCYTCPHAAAFPRGYGSQRQGIDVAIEPGGWWMLSKKSTCHTYSQ